MTPSTWTKASQLIRKISDALDYFPVGFNGNPLNLLFIEDAHPILDSYKYWQSAHGPELMEEERQYFFGNPDAWPFPSVQIRERPDPWLVSSVLFERFGLASRILLTQREIGKVLLQKAISGRADIVALVIVDGLSYYDLPDTTNATPCLVPSVSITDFGHREIIGKPPIAQRFFAEGYKNQVGFSFYDTETNPLAADLYSVFGSSQLHRVATFDDIIDFIGRSEMLKGFIQITAPGLDHLCHFHRDRPPREQYLDSVLGRFAKLNYCLRQTGRRVLTCLTSDHGIMWKEDVSGEFTILKELPPDDRFHPRYIKGSLLRDYLQVGSSFGQSYSMLRIPYLTRSLKETEWGVHGGVSAWESLVPLIIQEHLP